MENDIVQASNELSFNNDQLIFIAEQAEKRVAAINTIMKAALRMTTHLDWVNIGGNPYLQETGASKIARLMGVSWQTKPPYKVYDQDQSGHYAYHAEGKFFFAGAEIDAYGMRSTRDDFFSGQGKDKPRKNPQDIDERDVKLAAYTNCLNNGIKRAIPGLRNITMEHLAESGIDVSKVKGYGFNSGNSAEMSEETKDKKAEIQRMLVEMCGDSWKKGLQKITTFTSSSGQEVRGKDDINKLSEKMIQVTYGKVKAEFDKWRAKNADKPSDSGEVAGDNESQD